MDLKDVISKIALGLAPVAVVGLLVLWRHVAVLEERMTGEADYMPAREIELEFELRDQQHTQMLVDIEQERIRNDRQDREISNR